MQNSIICLNLVEEKLPPAIVENPDDSSVLHLISFWPGGKPQPPFSLPNFRLGWHEILAGCSNGKTWEKMDVPLLDQWLDFLAGHVLNG
jgi:hypothetical protein